MRARMESASAATSQRGCTGGAYGYKEALHVGARLDSLDRALCPVPGFAFHRVSGDLSEGAHRFGHSGHLHSAALADGRALARQAGVVLCDQRGDAHAAALGPADAATHAAADAAAEA